MPVWDYPRAEVIRVLDGDTFWARIDHGCRIFSEQKIRLKNFNAAELNDERPEIRVLAERHQVQLAHRLQPGRVVKIRSYRWTYDRLEADVWYLNEKGIEIHLNVEMRNLA